MSCIACGSSENLENNHVAGRANNPEFTVPLCKACHAIFTRWQYTRGIPLRADEHRGDEIKHAALTSGIIKTLVMFAQRMNELEDTIMFRMLEHVLSEHWATSIGFPKPNAMRPSLVAEPTAIEPNTDDIKDMILNFADTPPEHGHPTTELIARIIRNASFNTKLPEALIEDFRQFRHAMIRTIESMLDGKESDDDLANTFSTGARVLTSIAEYGENNQ